MPGAMMAAMAAGKKVLIVDDDPAICDVLRHTLKADDLTISTCETGREASALIRDGKFDLVLLDVGLPDMSGLDVLAQLGGTEGTKFIVVTADSTPETLTRAVRERAYEYVRKPFEAQQMRELVQRCLTAEPMPPIEVISAKPEWFELSVPCTWEAADRIEHFMRHLKSDLPEEVRDSVSQAFRELLLNAIEWGGGLDPARRVRVAYLRTPRMLQYRIADPGPGFRFSELDHAAAGHPGEGAFVHDKVRQEKGLRPGGLGIMMVRAMADELLYNEKQNEVVLIKYLE
jgi:CheY-like chemotaxis protein/anti-sigma regulatory factor (Ser/Thr protein kinase)